MDLKFKVLKSGNASINVGGYEVYAFDESKMTVGVTNATIKAAKICGTPYYIKYTSDNDNVSCLKLERFDKYNLSKLKSKKEDYQSALNSFNDGIDITMLRWDSYDTSYKGIYKGGLVLEHIRPKDFAVANISLEDIQNQKWIMYRSFEEVGNLRIVYLDFLEDGQPACPSFFVYWGCAKETKIFL